MPKKPMTVTSETIGYVHEEDVIAATPPVQPLPETAKKPRVEEPETEALRARRRLRQIAEREAKAEKRWLATKAECERQYAAIEQALSPEAAKIVEGLP